MEGFNVSKNILEQLDALVDDPADPTGESDIFGTQLKMLKKQILEESSLNLSHEDRSKLVKYAEFGNNSTFDSVGGDAAAEVAKSSKEFLSRVAKYSEVCLEIQGLKDTEKRNIAELERACLTFGAALEGIIHDRAKELETELEEDQSMSALDGAIESAKSYLEQVRHILRDLESARPEFKGYSDTAKLAMRKSLEYVSVKLASLEASARHGGQYLGEPCMMQRFDAAEKLAKDEKYRQRGHAKDCAVVMNPISPNEADLILVSFHLDGDKAAYDAFDKARFAKLVEKEVGVRVDIQSVKFGSIQVLALAPGGLSNAELLRSRGPRLRHSFPVLSITLSDYSIATGPERLNEAFNRRYREGRGGTYWTSLYPVDSHDRGQAQGFIYPCPVGWDRYALDVGDMRRCEGWPICYHGTAARNTVAILAEGLRAAPMCHCVPGQPRAYFSPCIEYSAHPRYAKPYQLTGDQAGQWAQMVLMCRVDPAAIERRRSETLLRRDAAAGVRVHAAFANDDLEWLVAPDRTDVSGTQYVSWGARVVCYGIMVRTAADPSQLPQSAWWTSCEYPAWPPALP